MYKNPAETAPAASGFLTIVDVFDELVLPSDIRAAWEAVIEETVGR